MALGVFPVTSSYANLYLAAALAPMFVVVLTCIVLLVVWLLVKKFACKCWPFSSSNDEAKEDRKIFSSSFLCNPFLIRICLFVFFSSITYTGIVLCVFDFFPIQVAIPTLLVFTWSWIICLLPYTGSSNSWADNKKEFLKELLVLPIRKVLENKILAAILLSVFTVIIVLSCAFGEGICISSSHPVHISTRFTRSIGPKICEDERPCHLYLTFPENTSESIIVNFHSGLHDGVHASPVVYFDTESRGNIEGYASEAVGHSQILNNRDLKRRVSWVLLEKLSPNQVYYFRAGIKGHAETFSEERKFKTLPASGSFKYITGGDVGSSLNANRMAEVAGRLDPDFGVVGGDIAYNDGMYTCYQLWDAFLLNWNQNMITQDGRTIPMVLAIGNHEAGGFGEKMSNIPYYMTYFTQRAQDAKTKDVSKRKIYHHHIFSDTTLLMALDSFVSEQSGDEQTDWMKKTCETNSNLPNKAAVYHVPLYPSFRSFSNSESVMAREKWIPIFDQYRLRLGLENHDHAYKRTKPMKNNKVDPEGTVYIGDGAWGVAPRISRLDRFYLENKAEKNFVFEISVGGNSNKIRAVDTEGNIFDSFDVKF